MLACITSILRLCHFHPEAPLVTKDVRLVHGTAATQEYTYLSERSQVAGHPDSVSAIRPRRVGVPRRGYGLRSNLRDELDGGEVLQEAHEHKGHFVVRELHPDGSSASDRGTQVT